MHVSENRTGSQLERLLRRSKCGRPGLTRTASAKGITSPEKAARLGQGRITLWLVKRQITRMAGLTTDAVHL